MVFYLHSDSSLARVVVFLFTVMVREVERETKIWQSVVAVAYLGFIGALEWVPIVLTKKYYKWQSLMIMGY